MVEYPIWEFATDEEARAEQDETWVRPTPLRTIPSDACSLQVAADFTLADGTSFLGYIDTTTNIKAQFGGGLFGTICVFTENGVTSIPSIEPAPREVRNVMRDLGRTWLKVFPISFVLRVSVEGESRCREGTIDGNAL
jgi:hypothetical protein